MLSTHRLFQKNILKEDAGVILATGGIAAAVAALFTMLIQHQNANRIEASLLKCHDDDYLRINLKNDVNVSTMLTGFLRRSKLVSRLLKRNDLILVNNLDTARLLKLYFPNFEMFKNLFENKNIKYKSGQEYFEKNQELFQMFGILRSDSAITWDGILKSIATLGMSKKIDSTLLNDCVKANLYYLALVMRQLLLYKDSITEITFETKKVDIRQIHTVNH